MDIGDNSIVLISISIGVWNGVFVIYYFFFVVGERLIWFGLKVI